MRASRLSTLLQRLALTGAGLAAVAVLFAVGGGLVAFGLWPGGLLQDGTQRSVVRAPAAAPTGSERPRSVAVAPPAPVTQPRRATPAAVRLPVALAPAETTIPAGEPPLVDPIAPETELEPEPQPAPQPVVPVTPTAPLQPVTEVVGRTRGTLAQTLGAVPTPLEHRLVFVGDPLGGPGR